MTRGRCAALGLVVTLLVGAGCSDGGGTAAPSGTPAPTGSALPEFHAIWPEPTRAGLEAAVAAAPGWRRDGEQTALHFAREVLRWPQAQVTGRTSDQYGRRLTVARTPGGVSVQIGVVRPTLGPLWSVDYVRGYPDGSDPATSIRVRGSTVELRLGYWAPSVAKAVVEVGYDEPAVRREVSRPPVEVSLTVRRSATATGYVLARFLDRTGAAVAAWGTALPPGDFAAS